MINGWTKWKCFKTNTFSNYVWMQSEAAKQLSGSDFPYAAKQKYEITVASSACFFIDLFFLFCVCCKYRISSMLHLKCVCTCTWGGGGYQSIITQTKHGKLKSKKKKWPLKRHFFKKKTIGCQFSENWAVLLEFTSHNSIMLTFLFSFWLYVSDKHYRWFCIADS